MTGRGQTNRYSEAFKLQVLSEIEGGHLTPAQAVKKYGLSHCSMINYWSKRYRKPHLLRKVVRIEMPTEPTQNDIIKQLKAEKQKLESALAQSQLKVMALESLIEVAEDHYQIDIKKNSGLRPPMSSLKKPKESKN